MQARPAGRARPAQQDRAEFYAGETRAMGGGKQEEKLGAFRAVKAKDDRPRLTQPIEYGNVA